MPLDSRDSFKVAFLARCVEDNLTPEQMLVRIKEAQEKIAFVGNALGKLVDVGRGVVDAGLGWGIPLALAAPPFIGAVSGAALAKGTDIDDRDVADIKDQEVIDEYQRQSALLRRQRAARDYHRSKAKTGRIFL